MNCCGAKRTMSDGIAERCGLDCSAAGAAEYSPLHVS